MWKQSRFENGSIKNLKNKNMTKIEKEFVKEKLSNLSQYLEEIEKNKKHNP